MHEVNDNDMAIGISIISMLYSYKTTDTQNDHMFLSFLWPYASKAFCPFVRRKRAHLCTHNHSACARTPVGMAGWIVVSQEPFIFIRPHSLSGLGTRRPAPEV